MAEAGPWADYAPEQAQAPAEIGPWSDFAQPDVAPATAGQPARITVRPPQETPAGAEPTGTAFGRGLTTGATFNFYDELTGLARAGGLEPDDPNVAHAIKALAIGGYKKLTGNDEEANRLYDEQVAATRKQTEQMQQEQPGAFLAGNVAGALAVPTLGALKAGAAIGTAATPLLGRAAPLAGRTIAGGLAGAGFGGMAGLGEAQGTLGERLPAAGVGAAIGGAVGAAAAPVVEGLVAGGGKVAQQAGRYLFPSADLRAARAIQGTEAAAQRTDPSAVGRLTQAEYAATPEATRIELGGEQGRALARWAANASPEARDVLGQMVGERYGERADRVTGWLNRTFNYPDAAAQSQAIQQTAKSVNAPAYQRSFAEGRAGIWDEGLQALSQAPPMQDAIKAATRTAQTKSAGEVMAPGTTAATITTRWISPDGKPTLEFWDLIKRELGDEIAVNRRAGRASAVADLTDLKNAMVGKLDEAVPSYKATREGAAGFFGQDNALDLGKSWIARNTDPRQVARQWTSLSPQEQKLAQDGFVSAYTQALTSAGGGGVTSLLNRVNQSKNANQTLNIVLGSQRAKELEGMLRIENIMQKTKVATEGNSTTARQLVELGVAGGAPAIGGIASYYGQDPKSIAYSALVSGLALRGRGLDPKVAQRVAEMLVSRDPAVMTRGLNIAARNDKIMNAIRSVDQAIGQAGVYATTPSPQ